MKPFAFLNKQLIKGNAKVGSTIILLSALFIGLSGCGQPTQQASNNELDKTYPSQAGGTLIEAMLGEPSSLISMIAGEAPSSAISSNIFNRLLKYNKNLDLEGELAETWQVSTDQKTITFKLKPNLKWADGKPLTSADVLWTWQAVTDDKNGSPYASDYNW